MRIRVRALVAAITTALIHVGTAPSYATLLATRVASSIDRPVFVTAPADDTSRLFIVEQHSGRIRILNLPALTLNATPFLTISDVARGNEQGLLGLAFHPNYSTNGLFFVNYTDADGDTMVARYQVSGNPAVADPNSAMTILHLGQPQANHNGGWIGFGPDQYLYIATGDGGAADDQGSGHSEPDGNGQDTTDNWLGKILRIDVDTDAFADPSRNYAIPPTNPFVATPEDDEIWAYGLRNPWRCSFDRLTGDFYIGDVGQHAREEINIRPPGSSAAFNFGWRLREGTTATQGGVGGTQPPNGINPIYDYGHGVGPSDGFAVTGGYVYRGPLAALQGHYFFADFATENIWSLKWDGSDPSTFDGTSFTEFNHWAGLIVPTSGTIGQISSFGEDAAGNLYIVDLGGEIFRLDSAPTLGSTDHFFFYKTSLNAAAPDFDAFGPVQLTDQLRSSTYDVYSPTALGLPSDRNGTGVFDAATHLEEYKVKESLGAVRFARLHDVLAVNACNALRLTLKKPVSLLVPTARDLMDPGPPPDPMAHILDHFLCYGATARGRLPARMQVDVADEFQLRRYDLRKITKLCLPTAKSGSPLYLTGPNAGMPTKTIDNASVQNPEDHLVCYAARPARQTITQNGCVPTDPADRGTPLEPPQPPHSRVLGMYVNNQFGDGRLDSKKEIELCIPSAVLLPP